MGKRLTLYIIAGMVLGLIVGAVLHSMYPAKDPELLAIADDMINARHAHPCSLRQ